MRKHKLQSHDMAVYDEVMAAAEVGYLGITTPEGYPRVVPLNFTAVNRIIYFHGAVEGEKYGVLKTNPRVTFAVDVPYSVIPSYWLSSIGSTGATHYFKSVLIKGTGRIVHNDFERHGALQKLMEKYQPEGNFPEVTTQEEVYKSVMQRTAIFRVDPDHIDIKIKFCQNKPEPFQRALITKLEERGTPRDLRTAAEIRKMLDES